MNVDMSTTVEDREDVASNMSVATASINSRIYDALLTTVNSKTLCAISKHVRSSTALLTRQSFAARLLPLLPVARSFVLACGGRKAGRD